MQMRIRYAKEASYLARQGREVSVVFLTLINFAEYHYSRKFGLGIAGYRWMEEEDAFLGAVSVCGN